MLLYRMSLLLYSLCVRRKYAYFTTYTSSQGIVLKRVLFWSDTMLWHVLHCYSESDSVNMAFGTLRAYIIVLPAALLPSFVGAEL